MFEDYERFIRIIFSSYSNEAIEYALNFAKIYFAIFFSIIFLVILISLFKIFKKAGEKPWKVFIPVYNFIVLYRISGINPLFLVTFLLMFIPNISIMGFVIWNIVDATQKGLLVRKFGKSIWFVIGIIFFDFIFYPIIAFDKSEYKK